MFVTAMSIATENAMDVVHARFREFLTSWRHSPSRFAAAASIFEPQKRQGRSEVEVSVIDFSI
jgi:hypothetical protein